MPFRSWASGSGGAGSIASDAPTVAMWGYQLYGARLLPPTATKAMMPPLKAVAPAGGSAGDSGNGPGTLALRGSDYGLGTIVMHGYSVNPLFGHNGGAPGYSASLLVVSPALHLSVALLVAANSKVPTTDQLPGGLVQPILAALS